MRTSDWTCPTCGYPVSSRGACTWRCTNSDCCVGTFWYDPDFGLEIDGSFYPRIDPDDELHQRPHEFDAETEIRSEDT